MKRIFFAFIFSFLLLSVIHPPNFSLTGLTGETHSIQSEPRFFPHAIFPREPKLQDAQPLSGFASTGIASYGASGTIRTNAVKGTATVNQLDIGFFSSILSNNSAVISYFGSKNATLQENAVLWLNGFGAYWTQNVVFISQTGLNTYVLQLVNNIWNFSSLFANMAQGAVSGQGSVQCFTLNNISSCPYITVANVISVTLPFTVDLTLVLSRSNGAATVQFGYDINDASGSFSGIYDNATLYPARSNVNASYQIGGETPLNFALGGGTFITLPSDLEFVFGGPGGGAGVFVNSISATEHLFYMDGTKFVPVLDAFSVGSDTGEQTYGVSVSRGFGDTNSPSSVLSTGFVSAYRLWPISPLLSTSFENNFSGGYVDITGSLLYPSNVSSSTVSPAASLSVQETVRIPSKPNYSIAGITTTDSDGKFHLTFKPDSEGLYNITIEYSGSVAFFSQREVTEFAVSEINVTGSLGEPALLALNSTYVLVRNLTSLLVPVQVGSTITASFLNSGNAGGQTIREGFNGFHDAQTNFSSNSILLDGSTPKELVANFEPQYYVTVFDPYSSTNQSNWYNAGQALQLNTAPVVSTPNGSLMFEGWLVNGKIVNSSQIALEVNSPLVITAEYARISSGQSVPPINTEAILLSAILLIIGLGLGFLLSRMSRRRI